MSFYRDGYQGGMYGEYGGYDIILIKLSQPVSPDLASCLPGLQYKTKKGINKIFIFVCALLHYNSYYVKDALIGGYGRYRRVPCETTAKGPQVRLRFRP